MWAFCGPSCVKLRAAVTNFGPRATLCRTLATPPIPIIPGHPKFFFK